MDDKKNNQSNITDSETSQDAKLEANLNVMSSNSDKIMTNKDMSDGNTATTKSGDVVTRSINTKVNAMQISGWDGFNKLSIEMKKIEGADFKTKSTAIHNMGPIIASLQSTRPDWMKTEEITEDIEDVYYTDIG
ncbi:hypothetical protein BFP78_15320 [Gaetbulibacter sp. 5U11]|nr:hypothetical protein BFP78_15320 [Gaetbulibacter sp. 5U11]